MAEKYEPISDHELEAAMDDLIVPGDDGETEILTAEGGEDFIGAELSPDEIMKHVIYGLDEADKNRFKQMIEDSRRPIDRLVA